MTTQEFKHLMIEYAMTRLQAEWWTFSDYYQLNEGKVDYTMYDDYGIAYIIYKDDRIELATVYFKDVARVLSNPFSYTEKPFMGLVDKYGLEVPPEHQPIIIQESEEQEICQETN